MNTLQLKVEHLTPYLNSEVKVYWDLKKHDKECDDSKSETSTFPLAINNIDYVIEKQFKLILRPLSDLAKEIEINGEKIIPIVELAKIGESQHFGGTALNMKTEKGMCGISFISKENSELMVFTYIYIQDGFFIKNEKNDDFIVTNVKNIYRKLYELGFDLDNLIEKGLAVDINTIK
jgi:hypothetical protein